MNDENGTLTMSFPPDFPWRHLVIEGDEEVNLAEANHNGKSADTGAVPPDNERNDNQPRSAT